MKRFLKSAFLAMMAFLLFCGSVLAAWEYYFPTIVVDTSNTTRNYHPVLLGYGGQSLVDTSRIAANGTDTNMQVGSTNIKYMLSTTNVTAVIPTIPSGGSATANLYTGYTPVQTGFPIITGEGGYVTVSDNTALEMGNNFTLQYAGYTNNSSGTNKHFYNKSDAFRVSVTNTGEISALILAAGSSIIQALQNNTQFIYGGGFQRAGQRFDDFQGATITRVDFYLYKTLLPVGTGYGRVRLVSDDSILGTLGTVDVASLGGAFAWVSFNTTAVEVPWNADIRISFEYNGGDAANYVNFGIDTADVSVGQLTRYSGGAWADVPAWDATFRCYYTAVTCGVSASGVSTGVHTLGVSANSTNLTIMIDGIASNTTALGGASVPNNLNNILLIQGNVMPYADNITLSVNGTPQLYLAPLTMLTGATIPDREVATVNDGTITWGSNNGITLSYGEMVSYESYIATVNATSGFSMPTATIPSSWFASGGNTSALPFYDSFISVSTQTGQPVQQIYALAIIGVAFGAFIGVVTFTRSALMAYMAMVMVLGFGASMTVIPGWIVFSLIIVGGGIMFLYRQVAY